MKIKAPETYVKGSEVAIAVVTGILAFVCTVPIPDPFSGGILNAPILAAIPGQVAVIAWILPVGIYYGFMVNAQIRFNDMVKLYTTEVAKAATRQVIFRAQLQQLDNRTIWTVRNCNSFVWTGAEVLLEKNVGGKTANQKHKLGVVASGERVEIESTLAPEETAQWRLMVLTSQGNHIDFPDVGPTNSFQCEDAEMKEAVGM